MDFADEIESFRPGVKSSTDPLFVLSVEFLPDGKLEAIPKPIWWYISHMHMLQLTDEQLDWLAERIPDPPRNPLGGRPPANKRKTLRGIFWMLDNGAKWKDLPAEFGPKSAVHRWFQTWVEQGVFEGIMRDAGRLVEQRGQYRLCECFVDGTFSKARGGGDGIGCTRVGKGVKIMVLVDTQGLPVAVDTMSTAPHRANRKIENKTQDGRPLCRYARRWTVERTIGWFQNFRRLCIRWEKSTKLFQGYLHLGCALLLLMRVLG